MRVKSSPGPGKSTSLLWDCAARIWTLHPIFLRAPVFCPSKLMTSHFKILCEACFLTEEKWSDYPFPELDRRIFFLVYAVTWLRPRPSKDPVASPLSPPFTVLFSALRYTYSARPVALAYNCLSRGCLELSLLPSHLETFPAQNSVPFASIHSPTVSVSPLRSMQTNTQTRSSKCEVSLTHPSGCSVGFWIFGFLFVCFP